MQFAENPCFMSHMHENFEKMCTLKFDMNKYSSHWKTTYQKWQNHRKPTLTYAKAATYNYNKKLCVCCNRHMQKHVCKMYNKVDYDFTNFVVSQCLQHVSNSCP